MASTRLMLFPAAVRRGPAVDAWLQAHAGPLGDIARHWLALMRARAAGEGQ